MHKRLGRFFLCHKWTLLTEQVNLHYLDSNFHCTFRIYLQHMLPLTSVIMIDTCSRLKASQLAELSSMWWDDFNPITTRTLMTR